MDKDNKRISTGLSALLGGISRCAIAKARRMVPHFLTARRSSNVYIAAGNINMNPASSGHTSPQRFNDAPTDLLGTHFTGRRMELKFLQETFKSPSSAVPIRCVVYGMPGLGKTCLVLQYATESFDQGWYSQVIWMSGTTVEKLNKGMTKILDLVGHPERHRTEQDAKLTAARLWLEGSHRDDKIRWLLIIDNVGRSSLKFLRAHLPRTSAQGSILFTTRTADVADALVDITTPSHHKLEIHVPDMIDATHLFFSNAGMDTNNTTSTQTTQAKDLIETLGSLPLAIVHAAAYRKQTQTSLEDIIQLYQSESKGEMLRWENDLTAYQERSVTATFEALFVELDRDSSDVARFLTLLSFLDPEKIQLKMLVDGAEVLSQREESPTATSSERTAPLSSDFRSLLALILSKIRLMEAVLKFQRLSLVGRVSRDDRSALRIHDLVQYMVTQRAKKVDTYRDFLRSTVSLVCRAFERIEYPDQPKWWPDCETFMPHLHSLNERWSGVRGVNIDLAKVDVDIAEYLISRGRYGEAEAMSKRCVGLLEQECGGDHADTLHAAHILALVYYRQGRHSDAETAYERVIEGRKKTLGADDNRTLLAMNDLALVYEEQGRPSEGEELLKPAVAGFEKSLGPHHPWTLAAMSNMARAYRDQGRYDDAEPLFKSSLAGKEEHLGPHHTSTLVTVYDSGLSYELQGRHAEAEELYTRALNHMEQHLGPENPATLKTVFRLGHLRLSQKRYSEAEEHFKRAFSGRMQRLGADHPHTCRAVTVLAEFYRLQGRHSEADALLGSVRRD